MLGQRSSMCSVSSAMLTPSPPAISPVSGSMPSGGTALRWSRSRSLAIRFLHRIDVQSVFKSVLGDERQRVRAQTAPRHAPARERVPLVAPPAQRQPVRGVVDDLRREPLAAEVLLLDDVVRIGGRLPAQRAAPAHPPRA